jgi:hypothetical protein
MALSRLLGKAVSILSTTSPVDASHVSGEEKTGGTTPYAG